MRNNNDGDRDRPLQERRLIPQHQSSIPSSSVVVNDNGRKANNRRGTTTFFILPSYYLILLLASYCTNTVASFSIGMRSTLQSTTTLRRHSNGLSTCCTRNCMSCRPHYCEMEEESGEMMIMMDRRYILSSIQRGLIAGSSLSTGILGSSPLPALATTDEHTGDGLKQQQEQSIVTAEDLAKRLRAVPTFTIVDEMGTPFMVVGEDAKLTAYFFTTYDEAKRILTSAKTSTDRTIKSAIKEENTKRRQSNESPLSKKDIEDQFGTNPWTSARISSVPLDFAVTLAISASGKKTGSYFFVQSAEEDIVDALALDTTGKTDLAEGKVPLFYFEDFTLKDTNNNNMTPVYFRKSQLVSEWKRQNPRTSTDDMPEIKVSELFALICEMVKPIGEDADNDLKSIGFVPPKESVQKAKECNDRGGKDAAPFKIGERIIVL